MIKMIEGLPRGSLGGADSNPASLSDSITNWQIENGIREPETREGLSIGQKQMLYNAGIEALNKPEYPEGTVWQGGIPWVRGLMANTWVPSRPLIRDMSDFAAEEREAKEWQKASTSLWSNYRVRFPQDDSATVGTAIKALQQAGGMGLADLNAIAEDPVGREAAFARIHEAVWQIEQHGSASGYEADDEDDDYADVLGGSVQRSGTGTHQRYEADTGHQGRHPAGSLSAALEATQKKMGIRK
ncbi:hypothetical protein [Sinorhizobium fredii]|uniref:hypothetical protein n=1 Tax=Rhizobium fredii TaxID=380 RepID=UPI0012FE76E5|nr:hypothetical protein [Sinorhizobium fredii]